MREFGGLSDAPKHNSDAPKHHEAQPTPRIRAHPPVDIRAGVSPDPDDAPNGRKPWAPVVSQSPREEQRSIKDGHETDAAVSGNPSESPESSTDEELIEAPIEPADPIQPRLTIETPIAAAAEDATPPVIVTESDEEELDLTTAPTEDITAEAASTVTSTGYATEQVVTAPPHSQPHEAIETPVEAIADDMDWHRIIVSERHQEARFAPDVETAESAAGVEAEAAPLVVPEAEDVPSAPPSVDPIEVATQSAEDAATVRPLVRLRQAIDTPVMAIADDMDWHRIIIAEHHQEALYVVQDIERCFEGDPLDVNAYVDAIVAARRSGNLLWYPSELLKAVLIALAKEILLQLLLPGIFLPPTDLISAFFAAAELGDYVGEA